MHVITHFLRWSVGAAPAETQTSAEERAALARFAAGKRTLVEVGVWHGVTTSLLKKAMDPAGVLYAIDIAKLYRGDVSWGLDVTHGVDERSNVDFRYYSTGSPFEYENVRFLYVRKRLIEDEGLRAKELKKGAKSTTQQENETAAPAGK